jgi:hypothetical protein
MRYKIGQFCHLLNLYESLSSIQHTDLPSNIIHEEDREGFLELLTQIILRRANDVTY